MSEVGSRKIAWPLLGFMVLGICFLASPPAGAGEILEQLKLDDPASLGLTIEIDITGDGSAVIKVTTAWPTVVNLTEVLSLDVEAATLLYQTKARSQDLDGTAFLEMWCHFPDGGSYFSRGLDSTLTGTTDWQTLRTRFLLQAGQRPERVTLNLVINGRGTVWIAHGTLEVEPLP